VSLGLLLEDLYITGMVYLHT